MSRDRILIIRENKVTNTRLDATISLKVLTNSLCVYILLTIVYLDGISYLKNET